MKYMTKEWYNQCQMASTHFDILEKEQLWKNQRIYWNKYKEMFPTPPEFMERIDNLHDCEINSAEFSDNDFIVVADNSGWGMEGYTKIIFKNAILKKKDFNNQEVGWCHHELYPTDLGYELHVLIFEYGSGNMYGLIVECENIEIVNVENTHNSVE